MRIKRIMLLVSPDISEEKQFIDTYSNVPRSRRGEWLRSMIIRGMKGTEAPPAPLAAVQQGKSTGGSRVGSMFAAGDKK